MKKISTLFITCLLFVLFLTPAKTYARLKDQNTIGWYSSFNTIHFTPKISLWLEYQWRREDFIVSWQQSLFRTALQYHFKGGAIASAGYGYILSYPFGDYPAGPYQIPEHRIYEQFSWNAGYGRLILNHRLRLEQRYLGKVNQKAPEYTRDGWNYLNRIRYQLRATIPVNHKKMQDGTIYAACFDEIMIGFGKNVNQNIFDQNRIGAVIGYQHNKFLRAEVGYINQIVQQSALVSNQEVIQYNNGLLLNLYFTKP